MSMISNEVQKYGDWRLCAWAGPIFMVGYVISWGILGMNIPPIDPSTPIGDLYAHYVDHSVRLRFAMTMSLVFSPFYFVLTVLISRVMEKIEGRGGIFPFIEQVGGVLTTVVLLIAGACWLTAALRVEERTPEIVRALHDFAWMFFDVTFVATNLQTCSVGLVILRDKRAQPLLPRWLAWISFAGAASFVPLTLIPFLLHGPFAWNGLVCYWIAFPLFFLWVLLMSIYIFKAIKRLESDEAAHT